ncbi:DUF4384 domain-containing protein [Meridianimarinicoccus roseus]|nr:DUF4384 domain-containing protein [Meridianimarinicoccus roseus]
MMRGAGAWGLAVAASMAAHGVLLAIVGLAVAPDIAPQQPAAQSRLNVAAYAVDRAEAAAADPRGERALEPAAPGSSIAGAAVPVSQVRPAALAAPQAEALRPSSVPVAADPRLETVPAAPLPAAATVPQTGRLPSASRLAPVAAAADVLMGTLPAELPGAAPVSAARISDKAAAVETAPETAALALPSGPALAALTAPGGAPTGEVLPRADVAQALPSLADARLEPGDTAAAPAPTRDPAEAAAVLQAGLAAAVRVETAELAPAAARPLAAPAGRVTAAAEQSQPATSAAPPAESPAVSSTGALALRLPTVRPDPALAAQQSQPPAVAALQGLAEGEAASGLPPADMAVQAPSAAPATEHVTAALAWTGGGSDRVDPASLAAIGAFMQPGDLAASDASAGHVRDGIAGLLASVPCARLQTTFLPETGQLQIKGHIPEDGLRKPILAALQGQVGASIPLADDLLILPRPTCGALAGIAAVGLAQSTEQARNPRVVGPDTHARVYRFDEGERLFFDLTGPDYPSYFYIDYFDADGNVLHLQPNEIVPLEAIGAKQDVTVGRGGDGRPGLEITVSPPFGDEIMVAFATSRPLYSGLRPLVEPAAPYLDFLKDRVAAARAADPAFKGEWVYFFVQTRPR